MLKRKIMISAMIFCFLLLLAAYGDRDHSKEWLKRFNPQQDNRGLANYQIQSGNGSLNPSSPFNPREYVRIIKKTN